MSRTRSFVFFACFLATGCDDWSLGFPPAGPGHDPNFIAETFEFTDGSTLDVCSYTSQHDWLANEVTSACLLGSTDAANPELPTLTFLSPECWGTQEALPSPNMSLVEQSREAEAGEYWVQTGDTPYCNVGEGVGTWKVYFLPIAGHDCEEYGVDGMSFYLPGGSDPGWSWLPCAYSTEVSGFTAFPDGKLGTIPGVCEPGEAEFRLVDRKNLGEVSNGQQARQNAALATAPVQLHEGASIREIEVLDMGGATAVHVGAPKKELATDANGFVGGMSITSAGSTQTFAAGQLPMSTALGTIAPTDDHTNARVRMRWTCDPTPPAGRTPLDIGTAFRATPPAGLPIAHPLTVGVDSQAEEVFIAPEGRAVDGIVLPTTPSGSGLAFTGYLKAYGAFVTGKVVQTAGGAQIEDLTFRHPSGAIHEVGTQALTPR